MKFLKIAALFALASLPLLLIRKDKEEPAREVDSDHIFDEELTTD
ncbi:MAG: hypothetical protein AAB393_08540 [Bacteroidota bacterium]